MRVPAFSLLLLLTLPLPSRVAAQTPAGTRSQAAINHVIDKVVASEKAFRARVVKYRPRVETYIQDIKENRDQAAMPDGDTYFLGYMDLSHGLDEPMFTKTDTGVWHALGNLFHRHYVPTGFVQMIMPDRFRFNRTYYEFTYEGETFLGDIRCLMFDIMPRKGYAKGSFKGRIWVEDQNYNIVRFDGTFVPDLMTHHFFHFDSWRMDMGPGLWLPAVIYTQQGELNKVRVTAKTRFWGYNLSAARHAELTDVQVDSPAPVTDSSQTSHDTLPLAHERAWERKAENDVLIRMQKAGLLAPPGPVDKILDTVVNNLEVTNNLNIFPEVRCRVMLTTPMEAFTVGHTIVVSRGLIDVLPDEASLAAMLAHELGAIELNQGIDTKYAFDDEMMFHDQELFRQIRMTHTPAQEAAADQAGLTLLKHSPYASKLSEAGLFLLALSRDAKGMPNLVSAHMGNSLVLHGRLERMRALISSAPQLQPRDPHQEPALPLGAHIKLDPWTDKISMVKAPNVPILSARDKLSFEITPVDLYLTRVQPPTESAADKPAPKAGAAQ